ncbi:biliverdin-producing heme oxygenase [Pseudomonas sp. NPDC090592]|uniref:biliverdin-producing heme oxygenase n=1 Tax=Pseudomonas sp. NPDC090592 TaxID=3364480 RepID=UPI00383BF3E7
MNAPAIALPETSRCKRLKAASRREHDGVDERVMAARPFDDRDRYGNFLRVQHRFHGSLLSLYQDEQLNRLLPGLIELSRFAAVEDDLRDLGLPVPAAPRQVCADKAQALGWLYCSEGSNLGAAFLFKQSQRLGLDGTLGARHLAPHLDGRASHWREFVNKLDAISLPCDQEQAVIAGSLAAFDSYRGHLAAVFGE